MELKALILIGAPVAGQNQQERGSMAGVPYACLDVLGASVLERIARRLRATGISHISLVNGARVDVQGYVEQAVQKAGIDAISATADTFWLSAEESFEQFRQNGADLVLVLHVGPYMELDYEELIQHHIDKRCRMTTVLDQEGVEAGIFLVDPSRRGDAGALFRSGLKKTRDDCERFVSKGYINRLQSASDFRRLAIDGLLEKNAVGPVGRELKPGVWAGEGARVHRKARVLAPAFIGAYSKIQAAALITRCGVIEHHAEIDCGTVIENSTVLPYTYVGAGLDVMHSIVGFRQIAHLVRDVAVEIGDGKLVGPSPASSVFRMLGSTAAFFAVLPRKCLGVIGRVRKTTSARPPNAEDAAPQSLATPDVRTPASGQEVGEFPASFVVVRRYGEH